ncbi:hypothetical protein EK21DRAFT_87439 [Setomelanomma holmii]|uniref:RanBP2-type domain-containing protein n=1 Tax=Setomelanomma holmii TaxID=210430 RepID=A0A9P4LLY8_9PLEO|nr:hypothetical protein EK21DRAFT_87439 [Setomelanomma holmii]
MARPNPAPIPQDMWVCDICKAGNLIELYPYQCPACEHWRGDCCYGPGQPQPDGTGLFPDHPQLSRRATGHDHLDQHVFQGSHGMNNGSDTPCHNHASDFDDMWHCNECGADNGNWFGDVCSVCGASKATSAYSTPVPNFVSYGGAGSPDPDAWTCGNCGSANSGFFDTHCGACGAEK